MHRFFSSQNTVTKLTEKERSQTFDYLQAVHAFARTTYKSIYIVDYQTKSFDYVSENPLLLCGFRADRVREMGFAFFCENVSESEIKLLIRFNEIGFDFFNTIPVHERTLYTMSYEFHLRCERGKRILVNHKFTPLFLTEDGQIWKALCVVSLSGERNAGNIKIFKEGDSKVFHYDLSQNVWRCGREVRLSPREIQILQLSIRGLTMAEIANEIFISPETVKFHRKKLFEKMRVTNISEAIFYAVNNKLF